MSFGDFSEISEINAEDAWPVQRLRIGWALVLFFFFETLIGKSLPLAMAFLSLGLGVVCLISAIIAIRDLRATTSRTRTRSGDL